MIVGQAESPCSLGLDHSLGQDAGEAPEPLHAARDRPDGLLGYHIISLALFSRMEGYTWALITPFGPYCGLFDFEETI
jgi:hypothetical protein